MSGVTMRRTSAVATVAVLLIALIGAGAALIHWPGNDSSAAERRPVWTEIAWPFPTDQWGRGKAFQCRAADCGTDVKVYIRAKIGFCNCTTGVSDDEELDRISDFELLGNQISPQGAGRPINVAWMKGRSRSFSIAQPAGRSALSIGLNDHCDAIVATAAIGVAQPDTIEAAVLDLLNSRTVLNWAEITLGL
jgi:hypothetical protein